MMVLIGVTECTIWIVVEPENIRMNWIRSDNSSLPPDSFITNGTLFINNVQPTDAGEYRCLGINYYGDILFTVTTTVVVQCKCLVKFQL